MLAKVQFRECLNTGSPANLFLGTAYTSTVNVRDCFHKQIAVETTILPGSWETFEDSIAVEEHDVVAILMDRETTFDIEVPSDFGERGFVHAAKGFSAATETVEFHEVEDDSGDVGFGREDGVRCVGWWRADTVLG